MIREIVFRRYCKQRERCNNPNADQYRYYGAKGIKVEYSFEEFWKWFQTESGYNGEDLHKINIGRIDHNKNYSLNNIVLQSKTENLEEMANRTAVSKMKKVLVKNAKTNAPLMICKSVAQAAWLTDNKDSNICRILKGKRKSLKGYSFEYWRAA